MARKRTPAPDPAPPEPAPEPAASPAPASPKVVDMALGDLLQLLGRTPPEPAALRAASLPTGINGEAKLTDLTVGDLLQLLASF